MKILVGMNLSPRWVQFLVFSSRWTPSINKPLVGRHNFPDGRGSFSGPATTVRGSLRQDEERGKIVLLCRPRFPARVRSSFRDRFATGSAFAPVTPSTPTSKPDVLF